MLHRSWAIGASRGLPSKGRQPAHDRNASRDLTLDGAGNAYLTGWTDSTDFPTTTGVLSETKVGTGNNAFVAKLDPTGSTLLWSTWS